MRLPTYEDLSTEQDSVLFGAPYDGRVLITGAPGTGKTVIAIYRAITALKQERKVQVVMYNKVLKSYTRGNLEDLPSDHIKTWHSWIFSWYKRVFRCKPPTLQGERYIYDWDKIFGEIASLKSDEQLRKLAWGHLIVDEGQDFPAGFYNVANLVIHLTGDRKVFGKMASGITVSADDNQRMDEHSNSTIKDIKKRLNISDGEHFKLTENYRNTRPIAELAGTFYTGLQTGVPDLPEVDGEMPRVIFSDRLYESVEFIKRYVRNNEHQTVGVFAPSRRVQDQLGNRLKADECLTVQKYSSGAAGPAGNADNLNLDDPGKVTVLCMQSCKGLEFDAVFIPELQKYNPDASSDQQNKMNFYVLSSRAREKLFFMASDCDEKPELMRLFPDEQSQLITYENV